MKRHKKTHSGVKPFQCEHCEKGFNRADLLKTHEKIHNATAKELKSHKKSAHSHQLQCCEGNDDLKDPEKIAHPDQAKHTNHTLTQLKEKPYKCAICEMSFSNPESLVRHVTTHNKSKREHRCEICNKVHDLTSPLYELCFIVLTLNIKLSMKLVYCQ